jgi:hypothetical protein
MGGTPSPDRHQVSPVAPDLLRKGGEGQHVGSCLLEVLGHAKQLVTSASSTRSNWARTEAASGWS